MLFEDDNFFFKYAPEVKRSACDGHKVSLIVPAWFSETKILRCCKDPESTYHTQCLSLEDMIYYLATNNKLVLPTNFM